jgi:hypothetical protein
MKDNTPADVREASLVPRWLSALPDMSLGTLASVCTAVLLLLCSAAGCAVPEATSTPCFHAAVRRRSLSSSMQSSCNPRLCSAFITQHNLAAPLRQTTERVLLLLCGQQGDANHAQ